MPNTDPRAIMPPKLYNFLQGLSSRQKDRIWEWADNYPDIACQIIKVVGREDGQSNEEVERSK